MGSITDIVNNKQFFTVPKQSTKLYNTIKTPKM